MGITINPGSVDEFNNLSTLKIEYSRGKILTPNRFISRHDLNAKNKLGADIPLSRSSKTTIIQENISPELLNSILNVNGFLATMKYRLGKYVERTSTSQPLTFLYPALEKKSFTHLESDKNIRDFYRFFCDLSVELGLEIVALPIVKDVETARSITISKNLQLIPILNLKNSDMKILSNQFKDCIGNESDIPIIAFKFYSFSSANLGYNMVMDKLDDIHEGNQATMLVDVDLTLQANPLGISAPHYGSFFFADLIAEKYSLRIPTEKEKASKKIIPRNIRIFCKNDLVATPLSKYEANSKKFNLDHEKELFSSDRKLQELFVKVLEHDTKDSDWIQNRPMYLSRVHENMQTRPEFTQLQKDIDSNLAKDYLSQKNDMNTVVTDHMKLRSRN